MARYARIAIGIDGYWEATQLASLATSMRNLYSIRAAIDIIEADAKSQRERFPSVYYYSPFAQEFLLVAREGNFRRLEELIDLTSVLIVARLNYSSPGKIEFSGIGEAVKAVVDLVKHVIHYKEHDDALKIRNAHGRIKNARNFLKLRREYDEFSSAYERTGLKPVQDNLDVVEALISSGLITSVEVVDDADYLDPREDGDASSDDFVPTE